MVTFVESLVELDHLDGDLRGVMAQGSFLYFVALRPLSQFYSLRGNREIISGLFLSKGQQSKKEIIDVSINDLAASNAPPTVFHICEALTCEEFYVAISNSHSNSLCLIDMDIRLMSGEREELL